MERRETSGEEERKRVIENACSKLRGQERDRCIQIFEKRTVEKGEAD